MKIGIIGSGSIGKRLAQQLSNKGHHILITNSRGPSTINFANGTSINAVDIENVTSNVDAVILAIPFGKVQDLSKDLFNNLNNDIPVIETTNYHPSRDGIIEEIENGKTHSIWVQEKIGRNVIKAFSSIVAYSLITNGLPKDAARRIALPVSGDSVEEKKITLSLVEDMGFDGYDAGSIAESWRQQPVNPAYCTDLSIYELKKALANADKAQAVINRNIATEKMAGFGQEYFHSLITGNYPDNFEEKMVNLYRSLNNIPFK